MKKAYLLTFLALTLFALTSFGQEKVKLISKYDLEIIITQEQFEAAKSGNKLVTYDGLAAKGNSLILSSPSGTTVVNPEDKPWDLTQLIVDHLKVKKPLIGEIKEKDKKPLNSFIIRLEETGNKKQKKTKCPKEKQEASSNSDCTNGKGIKLIEIDACLDCCNSLKVRCGTGCSKRKFTVRQNELVALKLTNINPLRYTYTISGSEVSLHQDGAAAFQAAFDGAAGNEEAEAADEKEEDKPAEGDTTNKYGYTPEVADVITVKEVLDSLEEVGNLATILKRDVENTLKQLAGLTCLSEDKVTEDRTELLKRLVALPTFDQIENLKAEPDSSATDKEQADMDTLSAQYTRTYKKVETKLKSLYGLSLEVSTMPYQPKARNIDMINFKVERTLIGNASSTESVDYNVFLRGGVKIDFSAGLFATGIYNREYSVHEDPDKTYTVISDGDTTQHREKYFLLKGEGKDGNGIVIPADFAIGTMMNVHTRFSEVISLGGSVGLSTSLRGNFQMLLGGVITLGKFQRISLHGGAAFGWYSDLKNGYKTYDEDNADQTTYKYTDSSAPMTDRFGISWFAGISYNITKPNVENAEEN